MALWAVPLDRGAGLSFGNQACQVTGSLQHQRKALTFTSHFIVPLHET